RTPKSSSPILPKSGESTSKHGDSETFATTHHPKSFKQMEQILLALCVTAVLGIVTAAPVLLLLALAKRWKYYFYVWLPVICTAVVGGAFCAYSFSPLKGSGPSGPTAPFGEAPAQAVWFIGSASALVILIYAFTRGAPRSVLGSRWYRTCRELVASGHINP